MVSRSFNGRFFAGAALACFMLAVAGCQSSDSSSVLNLTGQSQDPQPEQAKVTASSLRAYCPKITLRDGTAYFNTYAGGGQGDATKIVYQASIADVTRDCNHADGSLTLNVGVAGKVVPGPVAKAGSVTMPIRVVVMHGADVLYSKLHQYQVQVSDLSAATQFVFNDAAIVVPEPTARDYQVYAGFDEGPAKPAATAAKSTPRRKKAPVAKATPKESQTSVSDIPR